MYFYNEKWEYACELSTEIDSRNELKRQLNKYLKQEEEFNKTEREGNQL